MRIEYGNSSWFLLFTLEECAKVQQDRFYLMVSSRYNWWYTICPVGGVNVPKRHSTTSAVVTSLGLIQEVGKYQQPDFSTR